MLLTSYADITPGAKHYYAYMHVSGPNLKVIESESIKVGTEANFFGNFLKPSHCVGFDISVMRLLTQKEMQEDEAFSDGNYHLGDYTARYNDLESIVDDIFTFFQQHFVQDEWVMYDSGTDIFFSDYKLPEAYKPYFVEHI